MVIIGTKAVYSNCGTHNIQCTLHGALQTRGWEAHFLSAVFKLFVSMQQIVTVAMKVEYSSASIAASELQLQRNCYLTCYILYLLVTFYHYPNAKKSHLLSKTFIKYIKMIMLIPGSQIAQIENSYLNVKCPQGPCNVPFYNFIQSYILLPSLVLNPLYTYTFNGWTFPSIHHVFSQSSYPFFFILDVFRDVSEKFNGIYFYIVKTLVQDYFIITECFMKCMGTVQVCFLELRL